VPVTAWEVRAARSQRRLFLINKGSAPVTVNVQAPGARVDLNRMTPYDPTRAGRTLDAPEVRIDGQAVAADGRFPWLEPILAKTHGGHLPVAMTPQGSGRLHAARPR
jgi:hypothetical protein